MSINDDIFELVFDSFPTPLFLIDDNSCYIKGNRAFERWSGTCIEEKVEVSTFWPSYKSLSFDVSTLRTHFSLDGHCDEEVGIVVVELSNGFLLVEILPESGVGGERNFQAQRLRTLGMLAGGVAHDFNNVLAGIFGHVAFLKTLLPENGPHLESLTAIEEGAKKASTLSQQILRFSKFESSEAPKKININELVAKTHILLRGAIPSVYSLSYEVPDEPLNVMAVEGRLTQVLVNLVVNSRDALEKHGSIAVKVRSFQDSAKIEEAKLDPEKEWVEIAVIDNGKGIPQEVVDHIFEPYFSTKGNNGTGLGLSTVQSIIKSFGGIIKVSSVVGRGTKMSVFLPLCDDSKQKETLESNSTQKRLGGTESILIVDDEDTVRDVLEMSLKQLGYFVETASSGPEAIEKMEKLGMRFDLVLMDMLMPKMPGDEVFFKLREIQSDLKVLAMSGYTSEESIQRIMDNGGCGFIQKPFTIDDLAKNIRNCFDGK